MTIFGTRPEIIRLSPLMKMLDQYCDQITVHTGQNYHESLSDIFLRDLNVRPPDVHFGIKSSSLGDQIGKILSKTDEVLEKYQTRQNLDFGRHQQRTVGDYCGAARHSGISYGSGEPMF